MAESHVQQHQRPIDRVFRTAVMTREGRENNTATAVASSVSRVAPRRDDEDTTATMMTMTTHSHRIRTTTYINAG